MLPCLQQHHPEGQQGTLASQATGTLARQKQHTCSRRRQAAGAFVAPPLPVGRLPSRCHALLAPLPPSWALQRRQQHGCSPLERARSRAAQLKPPLQRFFWPLVPAPGRSTLPALAPRGRSPPSLFRISAGAGGGRKGGGSEIRLTASKHTGAAQKPAGSRAESELKRTRVGGALLAQALLVRRLALVALRLQLRCRCGGRMGSRAERAG